MNTMTETAPGTDLIPAGKPLTEILTAEGELERVLDEIATTVRSEVQDPSTEKGRKAIRSLAYKVARSKTALDDAGKELGDDYRAKLDAINARRKVARDRLDALADETRKPADEWEQREKERVAEHQRNLETIRKVMEPPMGATPDTIREALETVEAIDPAKFEEFAEIAEPLRKEAREKLATALEAAIKREQEAEELARLRAAEDERKRQQEEAEAKARAEREEKERVEREEKIRQEAAEKAAAEERARVEAEQKRKAEEETHRQDAERRAEEKRQANKRHRAKVQNEAINALYDVIGAGGSGIEEPGPAAEAVLEAIDAGKIPHVTITY